MVVKTKEKFNLAMFDGIQSKPHHCLNPSTRESHSEHMVHFNQ